MWGALLKSVFSSLLDFAYSVFKEERAAAATYEARARKEQLDSLREGVDTQNRIKAEVDKIYTVDSPSAWRNRILLLAFLLPMVGCMRFHVYHAAYRPIPPEIASVSPPPPTEDQLERQLEAIRSGQEPPFSSRETSIFTYAAKLERAYTLIRKDAIRSNRESGYPVPE